jgi:hypothetical protein
MRAGWVAMALLMAFPACSPVRRYQEAARSLTFSLDRVEPRVQLAFPLERSRISFDLTVGVTNPSTVAFHIQRFQGAFRLDAGDGPRLLGQVQLMKPLDLPAGGQAGLRVALAFTYQDLADRWPLLQSVLHGERNGAWELEGTLGGTAYGVPLQLPVKTRRTFGTAP